MNKKKKIINMLMIFRRELKEIRNSELCFERLDFFKYRWNSFLKKRIPHLQQTPIIIGVSFKAPSLQERINEYFQDIQQLEMEIHKVLWEVTTFGAKISREVAGDNFENKTYSNFLYQTIQFIYKIITKIFLS